MEQERAGQVAVIFTSQRRDDDVDYARAADAMAALAACRPAIAA